jgi:hypothetical protein
MRVVPRPDSMRDRPLRDGCLKYILDCGQTEARTMLYHRANSNYGGSWMLTLLRDPLSGFLN